MAGQGIKLVQQSGQKRPAASLRTHSKRDAKALSAIKSSTAYDQGGVASEAVIEHQGLFEGDDAALCYGVVGGRILKFAGDSHALCYTQPGGGKTTCIGFPVMAEWKHSSLTVDVDGEYARGVSEYRRDVLGHRQIFLNASALYGFPSDQVNPFWRIVRLLEEGKIFEAIAAAREASHLLIPDTPEKQSNSNNWIPKGARKILEMALIYLGKDCPDECTLAGLLMFLDQPVEAMLDMVGLTSMSEFAIRRATALAAEYQAEAQKQVQWKIEEACEPLQLIQPGSPYDWATRTNSFDPRACKTDDRPVDIYLMVEGRKLETEAHYISLLMSYIIEEVANAPGDRPFLLLGDEFSNLAKSRILLKALKVYRKRKIRCLLMGQGRQSTVDRYGQILAKDIEDMCGTKIWIDPPYEVARELSEKGGTYTATSRNIGHNPSGHYSTNYSESQQPTLPVSELSSGGGAFADKVIIEHAGLAGLIIADRVPWHQTFPYAEQLSDGYRDDFYQYQPPKTDMEEDSS